MNLPTLYEIASKDRLQASLGLAIAEARLVRSLIRKKSQNPDPLAVKKLVNLEREIDYLETTLIELKSRDAQ